MGVKALDRLEAPRLSLFPFGFGPDDRLPVRRQDQASAGIGDLDAVAAGLVDVKEERLLDGVLVRAGLDVDAVFQENVGGSQNVLARINGVGHVMKASPGAV